MTKITRERKTFNINSYLCQRNELFKTQFGKTNGEIARAHGASPGRKKPAPAATVLRFAGKSKRNNAGRTKFFPFQFATCYCAKTDAGICSFLVARPSVLFYNYFSQHAKSNCKYQIHVYIYIFFF